MFKFYYYSNAIALVVLIKYSSKYLTAAICDV